MPKPISVDVNRVQVRDADSLLVEVEANDPDNSTEAVVVTLPNNFELSIWSDGTFHVTKNKFSGPVTTETTLEKIWSAE